MIVIPQLYRGYIYSLVGDEVCYYLGSRFYSPKLGRFLNADKHFDTGTGVLGTNMFAYCNNNPVMNIDPKGESALAISLAKTMGIGSIPIGVGVAYITAYNTMLCLRLFQWSFTHQRDDMYYDFSSNSIGRKNWSSFIAGKLKKSQVIIAQVKKIIKKMGNNKDYKEYYGDQYGSALSFYNDYGFSKWTLAVDKDLSWAIGNVSEESYFSIYVKKVSRVQYKVYCTLYNEKWDFDNSPKYSGFTAFLVGLGVWLEDGVKVTKPFHWGFSVAFNYFV